MLKQARLAYFIGIGGIGLSAIARMFLAGGKSVSGSDRSPSLVTTELEKLGAKIFIGHQAENLPADCDLVIYTNAVLADNPELLEAKRRGITTISYPEALGQISADKFTIAIAGTHGKTTTTAMTSDVLLAGGLDPTVIVGSFLKSGTNFIAGQSEYLVVEADEYMRAFLNLSPKILAINNIDRDHLDYYQDLADIQNAFGDLVAKIPAAGWLICNPNDTHLLPVIKRAKCRSLSCPVKTTRIFLEPKRSHSLIICSAGQFLLAQR